MSSAEVLTVSLFSDVAFLAFFFCLADVSCGCSRDSSTSSLSLRKSAARLRSFLDLTAATFFSPAAGFMT